MLRVYRLVFSLMVLFAVVPLAARLIGHGSTSPLTAMFADTDGASCRYPCLFGILPGKTTGEEAVAILKSHPLTRNLSALSTSPFMMVDMGSGASVMFTVTDEGKVDTIAVQDDAAFVAAPDAISLLRSVSLGNAINALGQPDFLAMNHGYIAYYLRDAVTISVVHSANKQLSNTDRIEGNLSVSRIMLAGVFSCPPAKLSWTVAPWLGFTNVGRYRAAEYTELFLRGTSSYNAVICR